MYIERIIDSELAKWKNSKKRKPLLLRGARQVGKTNTIRHFGEEFEFFIDINFDSDKDIHSLFDGNLDIGDLCENLSAIYKTPIISGKTLLFFDEIQSCLPAIESLRFFYENMPELHVVAAGSLLEFAMEEISSFGVGRIRSMFMYPLSFNEFLAANGEEGMLLLKQKSTVYKPLSEVVHIKLLSYLQKFLILGGMPEVATTYLQTGNIQESVRIIDDIIISYSDDFAKYRRRVPAARIREVFDSVIRQSGGKFVYAKTECKANYQQIKESLKLLTMAGLVVPVRHSAANGIPLGAEVNPKREKMLIFDTGIYLRILNLDIKGILVSKKLDLINKGALAELYVGLELQKQISPYQRAELYYWHREARNSNAEIDYLITSGSDIIPVEVKSGGRGSMQSLYIFLKEKNIETGIRVSRENFSHYNNILVYPLYAVDLL